MAGLTKTYSGDFTEWIAGKILNEIKNYDEEKKLKDASPKVKKAARELRKEDPKVKKVQSRSSAIAVKDAMLPVHISVEQLNKQTNLISGKITAISEGISDTQKLIVNQNQMLEAKFEVILGLLSGRMTSEDAQKALPGATGDSSSGGVSPVSENTGDKFSAFLGKAFLPQIIRRTSKFLRRRLIPRRLRAGARILRMKGKQFLSPITRRLSSVRPKNLAKKAIKRFATSGIGRKISSKLGIKTATKIGGKALGKAAAKKIPILGAILGTGFAIERLQKGDMVGAGLEFASGIASIFPGVGTGISAALDVGLAAKDINDEMGKKVQPNTSTVPKRESTIGNYEMGSGGTNITSFFKQASSLLLSSMLPVAAAAGTLPEVKGQIKASGLDDIEVAKVQPPTGLNIGKGGKKVALPSVEPTQEIIPPLPPLPGLDQPGGDDRNILQKGFDWTKDKLGDAWKWVEGGFKKSVKFIAETVSAGYNFVDEKADVIRDVDVAGFGVGGERDDGKLTFLRTPWGNVEVDNPFANKEEDNKVESNDEIIPGAAGQDYDQHSGAKAIMSIDPNITEKGAAYISGNIQQESWWDGMKSWGEVLGDGTARNGGLVSWASWSDDPARLGKIEDHYGKTIDKITEHQQLQWMLQEMKQDYPSAYTAFTNPKATDEELKAASYTYWGYGEEGSRFRYAENIYQEMLREQFNQQKEQGAEKGAIVAPSNVSVKSHQINESSAAIDEIDDQEPAQPIVYLTNNTISTTPLVMVKGKKGSDDFITKYRFMSLGAA